MKYIFPACNQLKFKKNKGKKSKAKITFAVLKRDIHWGSMLEIIVRIDFTLIFTMNLLLIIF